MTQRDLGGLELDEDVDWQTTAWRAQRVGWAIGGIIILAALSGLCGTGYFSRTEKSSGSLAVSFERFTRYRAPTNLRVTSNSTGGELRLTIERSFLVNLGLEHVIPEPDAVEAGTETQTYVFDADGEVQVVFQLKPQKAGYVSGSIRSGRYEIPIGLFVYP